MTADSLDSSRADASSAIVLCLSGGGFRATFFHLGVVKLLRDYGLLQRVTEVFSVSGGSILAAHIALNWEKYSNPKPNHEPDFYRAATELVEFGGLDLRGRILRRWLFSWLVPRFRITAQLESYYSAFLRDAELNELPSPAPNFHFLTTSLTTGELCSFTSEGFNDGKLLHPSSHLPLALAVAASSAFPPVFPPLHLTRERLHAKVQDFPLSYNELADGGVFDNLGVNRVRKAVDSEPRGITVKNVIISDASAGFDWRAESRFTNFFSIASRSADILSRRVALLEEEQWREALPGALLISIQDRVKAQLPANNSLPSAFTPQDEEVQALVGQIRTDLDKFKLEEICALVRHGYEVALDKVENAAPVLWQAPAEFQPSDPCVLGMTAGWPDPKKAHLIPFLRAGERFTEVIKKGAATMEEVQKAQNDLLGLPTTPTTTENRGSDEVKKLRLRLKKSHVRPYGLWNSRDMVSWVLLLGMAALLGLVLWLLGGRGNY